MTPLSCRTIGTLPFPLLNAGLGGAREDPSYPILDLETRWSMDDRRCADLARGFGAEEPKNSGDREMILASERGDAGSKAQGATESMLRKSP